MNDDLDKKLIYQESIYENHGDPSSITYYFPWLIYLSPYPETDPNYYRLNPEKDKLKLTQIRNIFLLILFIITFLSIVYYLISHGSFEDMKSYFWTFLFIIFPTLIAFRIPHLITTNIQANLKKNSLFFKIDKICQKPTKY